LTWFALLVPCVFAASGANLFVESGPALFMSFVVLSNAAVALLACGLLRHSLSRRIYSFQG
jgi:hypothetical protein